MKVFGGYIKAQKYRMLYIYPIALVAENKGNALEEAQKLTYKVYPITEAFVDHNFDVVELKGAIVERSNQNQETN